MLKKIIAMILIAMMLFSAAAMAEGLSLGAWSFPESAEITDDLKAVFDKGMEGLVGVQYTPVAYLASQVVSGLNHCFLCRSRIIVPGAEEYYSLVYLYQNTAGEVSILNIVPMDIVAMSEDGLVEGAEDDTEPLGAN